MNYILCKIYIKLGSAKNYFKSKEKTLVTTPSIRKVSKRARVIRSQVRARVIRSQVRARVIRSQVKARVIRSQVKAKPHFTFCRSVFLKGDYLNWSRMSFHYAYVFLNPTGLRFFKNVNSQKI